MGFMDKLKGTAKQAVNPGGQMKERDKIAKINSSGVDATATVDSMEEVGLADRRRPPDRLRADRPSARRRRLQRRHQPGDARAVAERRRAGRDRQVKVDPDDPQSLLVWGAVS